MLNTLVAVAAAVIGVPGAMVAGHFGLLAVASLWYREPAPDGAVARLRFLVLVPAHEEELVIGDTLAALNRVKRADDEILVVADRCTDATAAIARDHGARVLERGLDEEPGRAAARQAGLDLARDLDWDAVLFVDADSILEPGFFESCERILATGADALQARSEAARGDSLLAQASLAAFAFQGVMLPRGRDRLRLMVRLRGTGMVLRRWVAERYRFRAPVSEDFWYSADLCLDGILPRHVESARLRSANVRTWEAARSQRVRYETGRMSGAREFVRPFLRAGTPASIEAAWHLLTPPFAVAVASLVVAAGLGALAGAAWVWVPALVLLAVLAGSLVVALLEAGATARTWLALLVAPWYVVWKVWVQLLAVLHLRRPESADVPTAR